MSDQKEKKAQTIQVPSTDPDVDMTEEEKAQKDKASNKDLMQDLKKDEGKKETSDKDEDELSLEDQKLKETLELLVERITEKKLNEEIRRQALEALKTEIRSSTASMTSVPKPLKFLRPHYDTIKTFYESMGSENKLFMADILSVLAMTMAPEGSRESLKFKLAGTKEELGSWGHEYVRHLAGEIGEEYNQRFEEQKGFEDLMRLVHEIIPFNMKHNAESDACDLLLEVDQMELVRQYINKDNHQRVCYYLIGCVDYLPDQEDKDKMLRLVFDLYHSVGALTDAVRLAIKLNDHALIEKSFSATKDRLLQKQMAFIMGAARMTCAAFENDDELMAVMGNTMLSPQFKLLARELDVQEAKTPEDIYKSHLVDGSNPLKRRQGGGGERKVDSAKQNLASTFVNAFVNVGFGTDKLVTPEGSDWMYKNKDHGMLSAAASLGMLLLWDVETGFSTVDKYSFSSQNYIKAGALLGIGMISSGVTSDMDAALGLLAEHVESDDVVMKTAAILGLGLAYAGSAKEDVQELLVPVIVDSSQPMELCALACLSLGLVYVGSVNDEISTTMIEAFSERTETDLNDSAARLMCVGLGLLFLNKGEACEAALSVIGTIERPIKEYLLLTVETCAYFGTGSVLAVQKLLSVVSEHIDDEAKNAHQGVAVLGIAGVAMGESIGSEMALRALDHVLQYGEVNIRRAVPLALGLLSVSNPRLTVMDTLGKLTHDSDEQVSQNAIVALGFLGAGTNNSRIANMLRQLAAYYAKEPNHLFLIRIAQGLLHMGKGLMTLMPYHSDHLLMSPVAAAGLLAVMHSFLDAKNSILSKRHYLLYTLVCSVRPRMLVCLDENLEPVPVKVRVGQAVDTVGQAGKPKAITGFQTHTTPVLLGATDRAELATDEWIPLSSVLEGFVIVQKNPDATAEEH